MTHQQQLAFIREKCIEANPSILDLVPGCVLSGGGLIVRDGWVYWNTTEGDTLVDNYDFGDDVEIIGRKIGVADVLLAMGRKSTGDRYWTVSDNGQFVFVCPEGASAHEIAWNLLDDDIARQSPECMALIASLLGNEAGE